MNILKAARDTMRTGAQVLPLNYRGPASGLSRWFNSGSTYDWSKYTGLVWENCVVWLALEFYKRNWAEAPLIVQKKDGKGWVETNNQELAQSIDEPNDWYDGNTLFQATVLSHFSAGNWYWLMQRRGNGLPAPFLMWHHWVTPSTEGGPWIDNYEYRVPGSGRMLKIPPELVVHGRNGLGTTDQRIGVGPLSAAYRSIASDNLGEIFDGALLHKMGVPGLVLSGKMPPEDVKELKRIVDEKFTVDGAGSTLVAGEELTVSALKATPRDMMLGEMRKLPVGRICGIFGLDPGVLCLPSDTSKHHANFDGMLKAAWTQGIRPVKNDFARTLTHYFRKTGELAPDERFSWDYSQVSELQEDRKETADVAGGLFQAGVVKRSEARAMVGEDSTPEDEVYIEETKPEPLAPMSPEGKKLAQAAWENAYRERQRIESGDE